MTNRIFLFALIVLFIASGCTHEPFKIVGGKGGSATVVVYPQHHGFGFPLDSTVIVYVKYNALDAPANGVYDDSVVCKLASILNPVPTCSFSGLNNGNYYFFAKGYDHDISQKVKGGIPFSITQQQSHTLLLPVGEE